MTHIAGSQIGNIGRYDTGQNVDRQKRLTEGACRSEPLRFARSRAQEKAELVQVGD